MICIQLPPSTLWIWPATRAASGNKGMHCNWEGWFQRLPLTGTDSIVLRLDDPLQRQEALEASKGWFFAPWGTNGLRELAPNTAGIITDHVGSLLPQVQPPCQPCYYSGICLQLHELVACTQRSQILHVQGWMGQHNGWILTRLLEWIQKESTYLPSWMKWPLRSIEQRIENSIVLHDRSRS